MEPTTIKVIGIVVLGIAAYWLYTSRQSCYQDLPYDEYDKVASRPNMRGVAKPGTMLAQTGGSVNVPSPVPLEDLQQNFLLARQVESSAIDTKMSQRKGAAYLDLRPDIPIQMDRTNWMNQSSIDDAQRIKNIQSQRRAWGLATNQAA
jgi:hypothetical protein